MEFFLTEDIFSADHAQEVGLINEIVPTENVYERATMLAEQIAQNSPKAIQTIKKIV